ncbi:Tau-tubulin kinase 2 [Trichinella pseudospiralis]|uniref:Tau-tubulin kinase 2 n=1 Tax=Trichinella pseudospiralis TaxID=6337 RepID=A0A0V0YCE5_TRIPS|nr:Tau-tubulin kinase 2 [Trichinella pseudospiralis]
MSLVGKTLMKLQMEVKRKFTLCTALHLASETLEDISDLHRAGFLHRDIKPTNFVIGLLPNCRQIYIFSTLVCLENILKKDDRHRRAKQTTGSHLQHLATKMEFIKKVRCDPCDFRLTRWPTSKKANNARRRAVLLSSCGGAVFNLIQAFISPANLNEKSFDEIRCFRRTFLSANLGNCEMQCFP